MKIAVQTTGKAPVNSGTVTVGLPAGRTAVVAGGCCCSSTAFNDGLFGRILQLFFFFFVSVCGAEDGKQAAPMFSGGPGGAEDLREEILSKCHVCLA